MSNNNLRGTGRTSKMLVQAVLHAMCEDNSNVNVIFFDSKERYQYRHIVAVLLHKLNSGIVLKSESKTIELINGSKIHFVTFDENTRGWANTFYYRDHYRGGDKHVYEANVFESYEQLRKSNQSSKSETEILRKLHKDIETIKSMSLFQLIKSYFTGWK